MQLCDWLKTLTYRQVMAAHAVPVFLLLLGLSAGTGTGPDSERGRMQLRRVQGLAAQPRYGQCWSRALENLDARCRDLTAESQSRIALSFTYCHLSSSGRDFPSCPEGSQVSRCTGAMDAVAFNTYTEFFTHTHSICHFLQSEAWQNRAENTMYRLTESSAGVAEQLQSTRQMAEDLIEAQTAALQVQQEILNNGEELRVTLKDSAQGLRALFSELSSVSREQQVALSELFNRVSFLQSFLLMEAHSLSSCCYNAAALFTCFFLTSTQRSSRARLVLLVLVCVNFYLERKIYQFVLSSDHPEHRHMELVSVYVSVLRRVMVCVGLCVLLAVCVRYRDPVQQSLQVLQQLTEMQRSLQEALQRAESLVERQKKKEQSQVDMKRRSGSRRRDEVLRKKEEEEFSSMLVSPTTDGSDLSHLSLILSSGSDWIPSSTVNSLETDVTQLLSITHNPSASPGRRPSCSSSSHLPSSSSPLVYSVLVEDKRPRYSLRSRRSEAH